MTMNGGFIGATMMVAACFASTCPADVRLASLFGDGMVLQRDIQVPVWGWADMKIDGDSVLVSSEAVPDPVAVRYAYTANPVGPLLYNREGLPASPFTTEEKWQ